MRTKPSSSERALKLLLKLFSLIKKNFSVRFPRWEKLPMKLWKLIIIDRLRARNRFGHRIAQRTSSSLN